MSIFEFMSVAFALLYSFAIARLLSAVPFIVAPDKRDWVHLVWVGVMILALVSTWWQFWLMRAVDWNPLRFLWALSIPSLIYLRVGVLVSQSPASIRSWREHYYQTRIPFFAVGLAIAVDAIFLPWVLGSLRWFTLDARYLVMPSLLLLLYGIGLASQHPRVHASLGLVNLLALFAGFLVLTWRGDGTF